MALSIRAIKAIFTADVNDLKKGSKAAQQEFKKTRQEMKKTEKAAERGQSAVEKAFSTTATVAKRAGSAFIKIAGTVTAVEKAMSGASKVADKYAQASTRAALSVKNLGEAAGDLSDSRFPKLTAALNIATGAVQKMFARIGLLAAGLSQFFQGVFRGDKALRKLGLTMAKAALGFGSLLNVAKKVVPPIKQTGQAAAKTTKRVTKMGAAVGPAAFKMNKLVSSSKALKFSLIGLAATAIVGVTKALLGAIGRWAEHRKELIRNIDTLGKTSSFLGINAESLQALQFAAVTAGVSTQNFNTGLQRFLRRLGEAKQGTGTLKKEIDRLGIALTDSNGNVRSGTEVFFDYLEAIEKTGDKQEKLRLTFAAFDTEGVKLLNLTELGTERLRNFREEAERLGLILPTAVIEKMEDLNDQLSLNERRLEVARQRNSILLNEMAVQWDSFVTNIKVAFLDLFRVMDRLEHKTEAELVRALEAAKKEVERLSEPVELPFGLGTMALGAGSGELQAAEQRVEDIEKALEKVRKLNEEIASPEKRADVVTQQIEGEIESIQRQANELRRLSDALAVSEKRHMQVADAIFVENEVRKLGAQATEEERTAVFRAATAIAAERRRMDELKESRREAEEARKKEQAEIRKEVEERNKKLENIRDTIFDLEREVEQQQALNRALAISEEEHQRVADKIAAENAVRELGALATDKQRRKIEDLIMKQRELQRQEDELRDKNKEEVEKSKGFADLLQDQLEGVKSSGDLVADSINKISDGFVDAISSGEDFGESMKNVMQSLLTEITKVVIKQLILKAALSAFGGGGAGIPAIPSPFAGGFAEGGRIPAGQFGVVGEQGPELIGGPANITPIAQGNVEMNVTVLNEAPGVDVQTRRRGERDMEIMVRSIINDDVARGGPIAKTMKSGFRNLNYSTNS